MGFQKALNMIEITVIMKMCSVFYYVKGPKPNNINRDRYSGFLGMRTEV